MTECTDTSRRARKKGPKFLSVERNDQGKVFSSIQPVSPFVLLHWKIFKIFAGSFYRHPSGNENCKSAVYDQLVKGKFPDLILTNR